MFQRGIAKFRLTVDEAMSVELPFAVWTIPEFSELFVGVTLIIGGMITEWKGDLLSRLGHLFLVAVVTGVIVTTNWVPILHILLYYHTHVLLLVGGLYFGFRGHRIK